jgi:hypothetical protein
MPEGMSQTSTGKSASECLKALAGIAIPPQATLKLARTLALQKCLKRLLEKDLYLEPKPLQAAKSHILALG